MPKIRLDVEPTGLREAKLITSKGEQGKIEPFQFFLRVQPAIKKFQKDLARTLGRKEEK